MSATSILSDAIKENIPILDYAQQLGFTPERVGNQYTLKEHDSVRINTERNVYYRHATEHGGSIIDFVMEFEGLSQGDAIRRLRSCLSPSSRARAPAKQRAAPTTESPKQMVLPEKVKGQFSRVFAYLSKSRGIDSTIVTEMFKRKTLYEDVLHNCVFVGCNEKGEPAFGCKRGTNTHAQKPYRGDCPDSDKKVGWYIDNKAAALVVTEAPIDAMSFMTMLKLHIKDHRQYNYLALGGVATGAVERLFEDGQNRQIGRVYLATDNDTAGKSARTDLRKTLARCRYGGKIIDKLPIGKDWNDDLKSMLAHAPQKNHGRTQGKGTQYQSKTERGISYEQGA
ncbi:MAG: toprim domain-containing protein [Acetanaerobacterium sp.]